MDRMSRATSTHHACAGDIRFPHASWRSGAALIAMVLSLMITVPARAAGPAVLAMGARHIARTMKIATTRK